MIPLAIKDQICLIDDEDYWKVINYTWHLVKCENTFYARTNIPTGKRRKNGKLIYIGLVMHRLLLKPSIGMFVDHINGNGLDNRRSINLRECNQSQNAKNRKRQHNNPTIFKGINWCKLTQKWRAQIHVNGKNKHLGLFGEQRLAAHAYDEAAKKYHGEFARLNFP